MTLNVSELRRYSERLSKCALVGQPFQAAEWLPSLTPGDFVAAGSDNGPHSLGNGNGNFRRRGAAAYPIRATPSRQLPAIHSPVRPFSSTKNAPNQESSTLTTAIAFCSSVPWYYRSIFVDGPGLGCSTMNPRRSSSSRISRPSCVAATWARTHL